jgi:hypothetical protein
VGATIHEVDSRHVPMLSNPKLVIEVITPQQTPNSAMEPTASRRMKRMKGANGDERHRRQSPEGKGD